MKIELLLALCALLVPAGPEGKLSGKVRFEDYADPSFVPPGATIDAIRFEDDTSKSQAAEKGLIR